MEQASSVSTFQKFFFFFAKFKCSSHQTLFHSVSQGSVQQKCGLFQLRGMNKYYFKKNSPLFQNIVIPLSQTHHLDPWFPLQNWKWVTIASRSCSKTLGGQQRGLWEFHIFQRTTIIPHVGTPPFFLVIA